VVPERSSRIAGGLVGLLVGDALGVPYEFHRASDLPPLHLVDFAPPAGYPRSHAGTPPGTWSDDGAQALALLDSLVVRGRLDVDDFGARLLHWDRDGRYAVDGRVFDIGIQTSTALNRLGTGVPAAEAGPSGERDNGNGSLMRVLPLALWHRGTDAELAAAADLQSRVTHGHLRSRAACAVYCLWARGILEDRPDPFEAAMSRVAELWGPFVEAELKVLATTPPRGSGYVADTLAVARAAQADDYATTVRNAIAYGDDTDTSACVAGGIAGLRFGLEGISESWRSRLRGAAIYKPLLDRLVE
jgi:ADP-ribosylglycohydrolase